ncbi:MAG TPA: entericidin A/B family lipoprotein [Rhodocyclaceae bacterium]|nr:entericidin A/B family lipoprotein [Rhodocyclaceae bacterium]HRQ45840.1 entericidin A/B family lipoprotein [Rhodocyclaceae bacterium]
MNRLLIVISLAVLGFFAAGCNTIHGVGKDIERGGEAIQRSAR